jgi:hypothetical protein
VRNKNLFKVFLRSAVIAIGSGALACFGLYVIFIDLRLGPPHMLAQIDEGGKASELRNQGG